MTEAETARAVWEPEFDELPAVRVTIDQIVARNIRHWRRAAGLSQEALGAAIGWSAANVSGAERSAEEGRERRRFDAETLKDLCLALNVPLAGLFLPPEDDGIGRRYVFRYKQDPEGLDMGALMDFLVVPDSGIDDAPMPEYRARLERAVERYLDETFAADVARYLRPLEAGEVRAARVAQVRAREAAALADAAEWRSIAEAIEAGTDAG